LRVIASPNYADAGALIAFGPSFPAMFRRAADYADRILKGSRLGSITPTITGPIAAMRGKRVA
jgi:hypothetical protein